MDWALVNVEQNLLCLNIVRSSQLGSIDVVDFASNIASLGRPTAVSVVAGKSGVVGGSLSTIPTTLMMNHRTFDVYSISLDSPLGTFMPPRPCCCEILDCTLMNRSSW